MADPIRIQKYLSRAGRASRREAERLMLEGRVRVNGAVVRELGARMDPDADVVEVDGQPVSVPPVRWIAFHKPPGVLTTRSDPHGGRTVYDVLPADLAGLRYIGRLDRDTEGLLLLTNDGEAGHRLQHPSGEIEREYRAVVEGHPTPAGVARLVGGVALEDGVARAARADLEEASDGAPVVRLVLTEGRKREVRRMLEAIGHPVRYLSRVRFGPVRLGDLPRGAWRDLSATERLAIDRLSGAGPEA